MPIEFQPATTPIHPRPAQRVKAHIAPQFGSISSIGIQVGDHILQHTTDLFRPGVVEQFLELPNFIKQLFPKGCKIFNYACSDGSEARSLYLILKENGLKLPIIAKDLNPSIVDIANNGYIPMMEKEIEHVRNVLPNVDPKKYFTKVDLLEWADHQKLLNPNNDPKILKTCTFLQLDEPSGLTRLRDFEYGEGLYQVSPELKNAIQYQHGDLNTENFRTSRFQLRKKPHIVTFYNQLYHMEEADRLRIFKNVYQQSPKGSLFMCGPLSAYDEEALKVGWKKLSDVMQVPESLHRGVYIKS